MLITGVQVLGDSSETYTISIHPVRKVAQCSCPAYKYKAGGLGAIGLCKHIAFVAATLGQPEANG